jgi:hypothetical protein
MEDGMRNEAVDPDEPAEHEVAEDPQEVLEYWTEERMRAAEPMSMPRAETD